MMRRIVGLSVAVMAFGGLAAGQVIGTIQPTFKLTDSADSSTYGQAVTLTGTPSCWTAGAGMSFYENTTSRATAPYSSSLTASVQVTLPAGTHTLYAIVDCGGRPLHSNSVTLVVNQAATNIVLSIAPNSSVAGQSVTMSATVLATCSSGSCAAGDATGTVTFKDGSNPIGTATVANGFASFQTSSLQVGTHSLTASYSGDNNYLASGGAGSLIVDPAAPTLTAISPTAGTQGTTVQVTLAGTNFTSSATVSMSTPGVAVSGIKVVSPTMINVTFTIDPSASTGTSNNVRVSTSGGTSNAVTFSINPPPMTSTSTFLSPSANPVFAGHSVTLTATVTPSTATGTVTFKDAGNTVGTGTVSGGTAILANAALATGSHPLTATYNGDASNSASTSNTVTEVVNPLTVTNTMLSASPNPAVTGQAVTLTATASPSTATGTVTFKDAGNAIGTGTLSGGTATFSTATLAAGSHSLTATYGGDSSDQASTSAATTVVVNVPPPASTVTALVVSPNPAVTGQAVTLTATVSPSTATGTVTFKDAGNAIGTGTLSGGAVALKTSSLSVGGHSMSATYGGDSSDQASTSPAVSAMVNAPSPASTVTALVAAPNPAVNGQVVTLTASVTPSTATGSVTFKDGTTAIGTVPLSSGNAIFNSSSFSVGSHSLTAVYSGDSSYNSSASAAMTEVVGGASSTVSLSASPNPSSAGDAVTVTARVTPASATGTVTVREGNATLGSAQLSGGVAVVTVTFSPGSHVLTATYTGDSNVNPSTSDSLAEVVNTADSNVTLIVSPNPAGAGQPVTLTAGVTPAGATGTITFRDGTAPIGTAALSNGKATISLSVLSIGDHSLTALYSGNANYSGGTSAAAVERIITPVVSVNLATSPNPAAAGAAVVLTAALDPAGATGSVTFKDGSATIGSAQVNGGTATLSVSTLTAGSHQIVAYYAGDGTYAAASSVTVTQLINAPSASPTSIVLTASPNPATTGQSVTLQAAVTPNTATGTVSFQDGNTAIGTDPLTGGTAAISVVLQPGSHAFTASYSGDAHYAASISDPVSPAISAPPALKITGPNALPPAAPNQSFQQAFTASGGTPPYVWSVTDGGTGLNMSGSGVLSGQLAGPGAYPLTVLVEDANHQTDTATYTLNVAYPPLPAITLAAGQPASITDQPSLQLKLGQSYPYPLTGTVVLTFAATASGLPPGYGDVQFLNGSNTFQFRIAAGSAAPSTAIPPIQLGSVAGNIVARLTAIGIDGTAQTLSAGAEVNTTITVPASVPTIVPGSVQVANVTSSGFQLLLDADSTTRDVASASVVFTPAPGANLGGPLTFTVPLTAVSQTWFASSNAEGVANGGAFSLMIPFSYTGDPGVLGTVTVTVTNSLGTSAAASNR